ncbi:MAG: GTPase ObgE [Verrucomicrobiota bacterium]
MFVDRVRVWIKAGKGGDGCSSFRREKYVPMGGPDGGDGGKGADVVLYVNPHRNNLTHLKYSPHVFAKNGIPGKGSRKTGRSGKKLIVEVPPGTVIYQVPCDEGDFQRAGDELNADMVLDLVEPEQERVLCEGGKGGLGNYHFKSSTNQAPTKTTKGKAGEFGQFIFELKSIADVGLVGFPNAGKSSLLRALSQAKPKVASYPFTTLRPVVGVIDLSPIKRIKMADIPGLIEGAHEGVGLGHDFLRHIERCSVMAMVLDMAGSEARHPAEDFMKLREEMSLYNQELAKRPYFVIANKMDLADAEEKLKEFKQRFDCDIVEISAKESTGLDKLREYFDKLHKD